MFRRLPIEWSHGEVIILTLSDSELLFKVGKTVEFMAGIELLVILPVAAFYLSVMPGCVRFNQLVPDTELIQCLFK